jgi:hypothetical protein
MFPPRSTAKGVGMPGGERAEFRDEHGVAWTVTRGPSGHVGLVRLNFLSERGERRTCEVVPLDDENWADLSAGAWQSLVRDAKPLKR